MRVELIRAWPRGFERVEVELPEGSTVSDALELAEWPREVAVAVFGVRVAHEATLAPGDRVEVLRPLQVDPKDARRLRAAAKSARPG